MAAINGSRVAGALILGVLIILVVRFTNQPSNLTMVTLGGTTMGPIPYTIKYLHAENTSYQTEVDSLLIAFNNSLSTYIPDSEISLFNDSNAITFQSEFLKTILAKTKEIYEITNGAFDPTVGPLVNSWGFGPGSEQNLLDSAVVDSLLTLVGFDQVTFDGSGATKNSAAVYLDFSAIAKGYGVDAVGAFLESRGIANYMVEIGGEVRCKGKNSTGKNWLIGIDDPNVEQSQRRLKATVYLEDKSLATSGNYRNFYVKDGRKISHTISPFTGFPVEHSLLSASVFADDCMSADAYATGFMVMGYEKSLEVLEKLDGVEAFLIYSDDEGEVQTYATAGIKNFLNVE
ncbi:MAG: FAD:protein FMN transferase [Cyclobacteriaceae bacterium]